MPLNGSFALFIKRKISNYSNSNIQNEMGGHSYTVITNEICMVVTDWRGTFYARLSCFLVHISVSCIILSRIETNSVYSNCTSLFLSIYE